MSGEEEAEVEGEGQGQEEEEEEEEEEKSNNKTRLTIKPPEVKRDSTRRRSDNGKQQTRTADDTTGGER